MAPDREKTSEVTMEMRAAYEGAHVSTWFLLQVFFFSSQHMDKVSFLDKVALHIHYPSVGSKKKSQCYCISVTALRKWC